MEAAAQAPVEAGSEMPRDTRQQKRDARRRRARKALEAAKAAKNKPNPPPKPFNPVAAAASTLIPDGSDRDDLIKLVYDELKRMRHTIIRSFGRLSGSIQLVSQSVSH